MHVQWGMGAEAQAVAMQPKAAADLTDFLTSQVYAVGEAVLQHDAELRELRRELAAAPADVTVIAEQNALLARQAQEGLQESAALSAAHGALAVEADTCRKRSQDLRAELDLLQARVASAEQYAAGARSAADHASAALDRERRRAEDWDHECEAEVEARGRHAATSEASAVSAERSLAKLQGGLQGTQAGVATASRVADATADSQRRRHQLAMLGGPRERGLRDEIAEARAETRSLDEVAQVLRSELAASEQRSGEAERKALAVARELADTSHAMARLRAEAAVFGNLRRELDGARREEGALEQKLVEAEAVATRSAGAYAQETALAARARCAGEHEAPSREGAELADLQAAQERALHDALRTAWETEARERRATDLRHAALEATWQPAREWLVRLAAAVRRAQDLSAPLPGGAGAAIVSVSAVPEEQEWRDLARLPGALSALCASVEALAAPSHLGARLESGCGGAARAEGAWPTLARGAWDGGFALYGLSGADVSSLSPSSPALSRGYGASS